MRRMLSESRQSVSKGGETRRWVANWASRDAEEREEGDQWCCREEACVLALQLGGWTVRRVMRTRMTWADGVSRCRWCRALIEWPKAGDTQE